MSLGERFRAAREARGQTLSEVAEHLRIRSVYLAAIEEENWPAIGAAVYTRGFLRTYARYLGLDPEEAVGEYNAATGSVPLTAAASEQPLSKRNLSAEPRSLSWLLWVAGAVAAALVGFVIYLYVTPPGRTGNNMAVVTVSPSAAPAAASPVPSPPVTPSPEPHTIQVVLTSASWLRITVDGNVRMEGTLPAGTHKAFRGTLAVVRVGNAGGVQISVDGRPVGKLGAPGDVVEKTFTL